MRQVIKDLNHVPPSLVHADTLTALERIALRDPMVDISDKIYKGSYRKGRKTESMVREFLNEYYDNKCAYCETFCKAEIEHYRPKKGVSEDPSHPGYYWLCYNWSNLLPSCRYCNTEGGKGNKFPILNVGGRVSNPDFLQSKLDVSRCFANGTPLIDEQPCLLHPEVDRNFENYLKFNISIDKKGITIDGVDALGRGNSTIEICNLNRVDLRRNRLESVHYHMKQKIQAIFDLRAQNLLDDDKLTDALVIVYESFDKAALDNTLTHTLLRKYLVANSHNFERHFLPYMGNSVIGGIALKVFKFYKREA